MNAPERANPFHEQDVARDKLQQLEHIINHQQGVIDMLVHSVGLLMRAENIRIDRAKKNADSQLK